MLIINPYTAGGSGGAVVSVSDVAVNGNSVSPSPANAGYRLGSDGKIYHNTGAGFADSGDTWVLPTAAAGGNFEVRALIVSGSLGSGTVGSWTALSSNQSWTISQVTVGTNTCTFTIQIRLTADGTVLDGAQISVTAQVESA